jgi:hypothetical protein
MNKALSRLSPFFEPDVGNGTPLLGDDGYRAFLNRAFADGLITEGERRQLRLVHSAAWAARAAG